jgi:tRNA-dihydrouridine synthase
MLMFYGAPLGTRVARKHLGWYLDDLGAAPDLRRAVLTSASATEVLRLMDEAVQFGERVAA